MAGHSSGPSWTYRQGQQFLKTRSQQAWHAASGLPATNIVFSVPVKKASVRPGGVQGHLDSAIKQHQRSAPSRAPQGFVDFCLRVDGSCQTASGHRIAGACRSPSIPSTIIAPAAWPSVRQLQWKHGAAIRSRSQSAWFGRIFSDGHGPTAESRHRAGGGGGGGVVGFYECLSPARTKTSLGFFTTSGPPFQVL